MTLSIRMRISAHRQAYEFSVEIHPASRYWTAPVTYSRSAGASLIRAFRAAIPIFVFWIGLLAGRMLSGKEPGNSLTLPDRPSPLSPITISIQGSSVYALYWTKVGANFQLRLAALDFEKRSVRKVDIAVEPQVSGLHQSIVAVPAQQSLALFYSLGTSGSTVSGRLTAVNWRIFQLVGSAN